jgi:hypothetical protein
LGKSIFPKPITHQDELDEDKDDNFKQAYSAWLVMCHCYKQNTSVHESIRILELQASVFLRFPKVEQHPKCMDHAILLGKPFGNCFVK